MDLHWFTWINCLKFCLLSKSANIYCLGFEINVNSCSSPLSVFHMLQFYWAPPKLSFINPLCYIQMSMIFREKLNLFNKEFRFCVRIIAHKWPCVNLKICPGSNIIFCRQRKYMQHPLFGLYTAWVKSNIFWKET